jgi:hypothetical protein
LSYNQLYKSIPHRDFQFSKGVVAQEADIKPIAVVHDAV